MNLAGLAHFFFISDFRGDGLNRSPSTSIVARGEGLGKRLEHAAVLSPVWDPRATAEATRKITRSNLPNCLEASITRLRHIIGKASPLSGAAGPWALRRAFKRHVVIPARVPLFTSVPSFSKETPIVFARHSKAAEMQLASPVTGGAAEDEDVLRSIRRGPRALAFASTCDLVYMTSANPGALRELRC